MRWLQLTFDCPQTDAGFLESILEEAGALSVTYADAGDQPLFEPPPGETPLWQDIRLVALFEGETDLTTLLSQLKSACEQHLPKISWHDPSSEILQDKDWVREWMDEFKPIPFGQKLWVCPSWHTPPDPDAVNLMLDPGLAFGTGTHPTTAQCLEWLDSQDLTGKTLIDYGCGSGILAIAGLKLGAITGWGTDIDPQALEASRANAEQNAIKPEQLNLCLPEALPDIQADLVMANILAGPLKELYPKLDALCKQGGQLILSGILAEQADDLIDTYQQSFDFEPVQQREEWVFLAARRR